MGAFANWTDGIAALYCAERELRKRGGRDALEQIARGFEARQNSEGGWDHGATFGLSFYPSTLVATTNLSLIALGFAQRFGVTHDSDAIASGLALLGDVQGEGGGMPYGGRPYMKGVEAARTCGTVLALSSLGLGTDPRCTRAAGYVLRNIDAIPEGHASTAFHVFMGALACSALGPAASESFDERILARVRAAQREDGSFDSIVPGSPDDMAFMADADTNRAYITAFHAAALLARSSKIAAALQLSPPAVADQDKPASRPMLLPIWSIPMPRAGLVAFVGERVLALDDAGHGRWLSAIDGEATGTLGLALGTQPGELQCAADDSGVLVWKAPSGSDAPIFIGGGVSGSAQSDAHPTALAFVSVDAGGPHWSRMLDGRVLAAILAGQHVVVRTIGGRIIVLARKDGTTVRELPALGVLPNVALCRGANDTLVMAAESRIACVEMLEHPVAQAADATVWERKNRLRHGWRLDRSGSHRRHDRGTRHLGRCDPLGRAHGLVDSARCSGSCECTCVRADARRQAPRARRREDCVDPRRRGRARITRGTGAVVHAGTHLDRFARHECAHVPRSGRRAHPGHAGLEQRSLLVGARAHGGRGRCGRSRRVSRAVIRRIVRRRRSEGCMRAPCN
jgi:hypothetical protein